MDRPFERRHKSFTDEHAADEPAMKECLIRRDGNRQDGGRRMPSGVAQKWLILLKMREKMPRYALQCGSRRALDAGTCGIQVAFMFGRLSSQGLGAASVGARPRKPGFLCNALTPAAGVPIGRRPEGESQASPGRDAAISATTCDAAPLGRRLYKTPIVAAYPTRHAVWRLR
jgi:hypothetical protein